jgi:hexulose-6-phosphate isomerase
MRRRDFLFSACAMTAASAAVPARAGDRGNVEPPRPGTLVLRKALKFDMVKEDLSIADKFKLLKDLGFDGVEMETPNDLPMKDVLNARDKSGLEIPGVVCGATWNAQLSHEDPSIREKGVELVRKSLEACREYGGTSVLVIPGVCDSHTNYADAYERSQREVRKLFPHVERTGVKVAFENVWNNFLLSPLECARFVDEINHPLVGWHFDVGNVVRYGWPEQWIKILNKRILKLDIKEYSRKKQFDEGTFKGFDVELLDGDCNWAVVNSALREIGFSGWASAEVPGGDRHRLLSVSKKMDAIFKM